MPPSPCQQAIGDLQPDDSWMNLDTVLQSYELGAGAGNDWAQPGYLDLTPGHGSAYNASHQHLNAYFCDVFSNTGNTEPLHQLPFNSYEPLNNPNHYTTWSSTALQNQSSHLNAPFVSPTASDLTSSRDLFPLKVAAASAIAPGKHELAGLHTDGALSWGTTTGDITAEFTTFGAASVDETAIPVASSDATNFSVLNQSTIHCEPRTIVSATTKDESRSDEGPEIHTCAREHLLLACRHTGCGGTFLRQSELNKHQREFHVADLNHGHSSSRRTCSQCNEVFRSVGRLECHASHEQHTPYMCKCGQRFSRSDVLDRHLSQFVLEARKYPCDYCKRHKGESAFRRKDHLTQHLRGYHHIDVGKEAEAERSILLACAHPSCPQHRGPAFFRSTLQDKQATRPFKNSSEYHKHMRKIHDETEYPCDISNCSRVGGKGYFREMDLIKHRKKEHPEAPKYDPTRRSFLFNCLEPMCHYSVKLELTNRLELYKHYTNQLEVWRNCIECQYSHEEAYQRAGYTIQEEGSDTQVGLGGINAQSYAKQQKRHRTIRSTKRRAE